VPEVWFDPQPFHVDALAAAQSPYRGLIASGLHTIALTFRLFLDSGALAVASLGSFGLDEIRWPEPVRPGDTLSVVVEVVAARPSASKPDRGIASLRYRTVNQRGETVMTMVGHQLIRRRP
jgi:acyl dehydratase